jgi:RNA polymerase sigma-70 factor, ECF subfamily
VATDRGRRENIGLGMSVQHPDRLTAKRLLAGDERAFREVFDTYFPKLYRFALARLGGDRDAATDAVQQTLCKAFEHLGSYRGEASLYGWMCQILRNAIADDGRRRQRERAHVRLVEDDAAIREILESVASPEHEQPEHEAAAGDLRRLIQATLDALPGHYGDVLEWKYVDGLSVGEIGARLTVSPKAAESLLTRARTAFRETITQLADSATLPFLDARKLEG